MNHALDPLRFGPSTPSGHSWPPRWSNRWATLGPAFLTELAAQPLPSPHWVARSDDCARYLGLPADWADDPALNALQVFSGGATWPGMRPLATVYSGHQFGVWAGQLGDGRALWLGETQGTGGVVEWQLKGSGRTPYSRGGDGRAVLRSSIREFLCSEAMDALGIPTTRALCITGSALPVRRESVETAAVVTRVAPSFMRFGHFEHFAANGQTDELRRLADTLIETHYPACRDATQPYADLLQHISLRTARLMADWQSVGFCHGVMNTDNMSALGLTLDYGPFGFLDVFNPRHICNHSDTAGRYAWGRQPGVALWNLQALASAFMPLIGDTETVQAAVAPYAAEFSTAMLARWRAKLGLATSQPDDTALIDDWLRLLAAQAQDFTLAFRRLAQVDSQPGADLSAWRDTFVDRAAVDAWAERYTQRLRAEASVDAERQTRMQGVNPLIVLRNHLAEEAIQAAQGGDFSAVDRLLKVLRRPYDEHDDITRAHYAAEPPDWAQTIEVSCSS